MTSPRRASSKSMSKSGIEGRSGLRNRSKNRPCSSGHRSVMPQGVGGDGAGAGAAAGTDADAVVLGPVDEVGDHEVVAAVALLGDDRQLHVDPVAHALVEPVAGVARLDAAPDLLAEPGVLGLAGGHVGARHVAAGGLGELDLAALGDGEGVVARLGHAELLGPQLAHLGGGLDVVAAAVELEAVGVGEPLAGGHADEGVVARRRPRGCCSGSRWWRWAGSPSPCRGAAGRRGPASRCRSRGPSARGTRCRGRRCPAARRPRAPPRRTGRARSRVWIAPLGQPVLTMSPLLCSARISLSMRGLK